jgi:hypothetical protein
MRSLFVSIIINLFLTAEASAKDIPIWAWSCRSDNFYEMHISPDGKYTIKAQEAGSQSIKITVNNLTEEARNSDLRIRSCPQYSPYYIEIAGSGYFATLLDGMEKHKCDINVTQYNNGLESLQANTELSLHATTLKVSRDDTEWRFIATGSDVTTKRKAREINIQAPKQVPWSAGADVWTLTGECVLDIGK